MNDWDVFAKCVPWFLNVDSDVRVADPSDGCELSPSTTSIFPMLAKLLSCALVTPIAVNEARYELLAWNRIDGCRMGWLCLPADRSPLGDLHEDHRELLASFGGIVERFNEPEDTWLLNQNDAMTQREALHDARFLEHYMWAFRDAGLTLPIDPAEYYSVAREANGNNTLCHRRNGQVIMFAPDHCFDHVTKLDACPEYTLYTLNGAATFRDWVNTVACQWLVHIALLT